MSSTRNRNTVGNYQLYKKQNTELFDNISLVDSVKAQYAYFPSDGLLPSKKANTELSENSCDIESFLFGIGSTNLESPLPEIKPEIKQLKNLAIIDKIPMILPDNLEITPQQRPTIT